jgi:ATP-dependent protease ClpP protease subunit
MKREIEIYQEINSETAAKVKKGLDELTSEDPTQPIVLLIDTPGGWVDDMMAVVNAIKECPAPVNGMVVGEAHSAGFVILQHCVSRLAYEGTTFLFHTPRITAETASRFTSFPAEMDFVLHDSPEHKETISLVVKRSRCSEAQLVELEDQERIIDSHEALKLGFIDRILSPE